MNSKYRDLLNPESTDFCMLDYDCAYLPKQKTRMYYRYIQDASTQFVSSVIQRGWRRFGNYFFYPICQGCNECKSLRIDTKSFEPSRSQKKAIKRNRDTKILIQSPTLSIEHIELYNKYHSWKAKKDNWQHHNINEKEYYENFVKGAHNFGYEVLYFRDKKLIGVDLIDIVEDGISSIYFFYDPDFAQLSLGTYSLIYQIQLARELKKRWIYLGYWVDGCKAFAYKTKFKPQELLDGFPNIQDIPEWKSFNPPSSNG